MREFPKKKKKKQIRLVAVSKTKPASLLSECYDLGNQRHFGENYVSELIEKSKNLPPDIKWHFIGHLQSNKAKQICEIPNLYIIESIHSIKLAEIVNKHCSNRKTPLSVMVQINTSQEESKAGCDADLCCHIVRHILEKCQNLKFCGLMTIGLPNSPEDKPDWKVIHFLLFC